MAAGGTLQLLDGIDMLADRYGGFLVDQFGVLHDARALFPGAREALLLLRRRGRRVIILSNSGKRAAANVTRLAGFDIGRELYDGLVTSGEAAWEGLRRREDIFEDLGRRCLFIRRGDDLSAVEDLGLELVEEPEDAEFVLLSGLDPDQAARVALAGRLARARALGRPLLCTNPDLVSLEGSRRVEGPGSFARRYAEGGGDVRMVGKPWPAIYREALRQIDLPTGELVAIGDSLHHDIAGAAMMGIDSALVTAVGVHAEALGGARSEPELIARIKAMTGAPAVPVPHWLLRWFAPAGGAGSV